MGTDEKKIVSFKNYRETVDSQIGVNVMHLLDHRLTTWREVFKGYQHIRIMTYSFGLPFLEELMKLFEDGEVIIGSLSQVRADAADLIATQTVVTNYICTNRYLQDRIRDNTFHMYVSKDVLSHGKIYLLRSDDGRTRTILASANSSARAWNGLQVENYDICDDPACYEEYKQAYEWLRDISTDEITVDAKRIKPDGTNLEELPMFRDMKKADSALVIHDMGDDGEADYAFTVGKLSDSMRQLIRAAHIRPTQKDGGSVFDIEKVRKMTAVAKRNSSERKVRQEKCPELLIDYEMETITINDIQQDLQPDMEDVRRDICCWIKYLDGYDAFTGNTVDMKLKAWKILNHVFLSPFIAMLRYKGSLVRITGRSFPMYLLLVGPRDNGKSELIRTCQKLVLGLIPHAMNQDRFSQNDIKSLDENVLGCPILIDDVNPRRWSYAAEIVKTDDVLIDEKLTNHPTYLLTANKIETVTSDVAKRVIVFRVDNQLKTDSAEAKESSLKNLQGEMSNAWFRLFAGRMFPVLDNFIECMQEDQKRPEGWKPDIYRLASHELISVIEEAGVSVPDELHEFSWSEYMGEAAISQQAIRDVKELYHLSPELFSVDRKTNELIIDFSNYEGKAKMIRLLENELPVDTERRTFGNKIGMKLDVIQEYTGLIFKPRSRFHGIFRRK